MKKQIKRGFTLVEMMIVVAIIAILAGVAVPQYSKYVRKSEATEAINLMKEIINAQTIYKSTRGEYKIFTKKTSSSPEFKVLNVSIPSNAKFTSFTVKVCGADNVLLVSSSTNNFTSPSDTIYMASPDINKTTTGGVNDEYYNGNTFIFDFINETNSGEKPVCTVVP